MWIIITHDIVKDLYLYFFITIVDSNSYEIMLFPYGHYKFTDIS